MQWVSVISSNLAAVAYDAVLGRLWIRFHKAGRSGGRGYYDGVPEAVYQALLAASSKGSYHHWNIRQAGYAWTYA